MRKLLASAALALSLSAPMVAMPPAAAAQAQLGLVNLALDVDDVLNDNEIAILNGNNVNVGAAIPVIAQVCPAVDVDAVVGLLALVASGQSTEQRVDCNATQDLVITQSAGPRERGGSNR